MENHQAIDEDFEVWPENWPVIVLFLAVNTQWRVGGMGGLIGLDYPAVDVVINRLDLKVDAECFAGLQIMEREIVREFNRGDSKR